MKRVLFCLPLTLFALPSDFQVMHGSGKENRSPTTLEITTSDTAILHWKDFSNECGELIRFVQPNENSTVLNQVISATPSTLLGRLEANGKVVLINQNGILVGRDAYIDTGSFIASTLDMNTDLFLETSELSFEGQSVANIVHEGKIRADGEVLFIGYKVENQGQTDAKFASVIASDNCLLKPAGHARIFVRPTSRIVDGNNVYSAAFLNGEMHASDIFILGDQIEVADQANIDASGSNGGGNIFIGGGRQGQNSDIYNAKQTWIAPGAKLRADALEQGDGGSVIVWSDENTFFYGHSAAQGGKLRGNGGFLEISGRYLDFQGTVSTLAPNGQMGMLLLDPGDIGISNTQVNNAVSGLPNGPFSPTGGTCLGCPVCTITATTSNLTKTSLVAALAVTSVTVNTTCGACGCQGDIFVDGSVAPALTWASGNSLTLNATRDIFVQGNIQESNAVFTALPRVTLTAGRNILINNPNAQVSVGSQNGGTLVTAGGDITVLGGAGFFTGAQIGFYTPDGLTARGPISVTCANLAVTAGSFLVDGAQIGHGRISQNFPGTNTATLATANINITTTGNITVTATNGNSNSALIGNGANTLAGGATGTPQAGDITVLCGGNLTLNGSNGGVIAGVAIGHGVFESTFGAPISSLTGNILVEVGGKLSVLTSNLNGSSTGAIGHHGLTSSSLVIAMSGNITVCSRGDTQLASGSGGGSGTAHLVVGHMTLGTTPCMISGIYRVSVGGNLSLSSASPPPIGSECYIGGLEPFAFAVTFVNCALDLSVCGNTTITSPSPSASLIGFGFASPNAAIAPVSVAIGGNLTMVNGTLAAISSISADTNLAVRGTIDITTTSVDQTFIGGGTPGNTRIFAGGSFFTNPAPGAIDIALTPNGVTSNSVDVRAGGDIQWPMSYSTNVVGGISIQANHSFAAGELWTGSPGALTTICTAALAASPFNLLCGNCALFNAPSPAIASTCGIVTFVPAAGSFNFLTTAPLTITGGCTGCATALQDVTVGTFGSPTIFLGGPPSTLDLASFNDITVTSTVTIPGFIRIRACHDLNVNALLTSSTSTCDTCAGNNTTVNFNVTAPNGISMVSGLDMTVNAPAIISSSGGNITLVVDNNFPTSPLIGPGKFVLNLGAKVSAALALRIFTALQGLNSIQGTLQGMNFTPGTLFVDTDQEHWCTYFPGVCLFPNVAGFFVGPSTTYTVFYKNCLQIITLQATTIIDEMLVDLHPYNEFPGWMVRFTLSDSGFNESFLDEPYYLRRRHLNFINHPKSWTHLQVPYTTWPMLPIIEDSSSM